MISAITATVPTGGGLEEHLRFLNRSLSGLQIVFVVEVKTLFLFPR